MVMTGLKTTLTKWYNRISNPFRKRSDRKRKSRDKMMAETAQEVKESFRSVFATIEILYKVEEQYGLEGFEEGINNFRAACKKTSDIVDNVFEFERYNAGHKPILYNQLVDIRYTLERIVDTYRPFAEKRHVSLELTISGLIPYHIVCDELKLSQIVANLLHNAIKYTRDRTTVSVEVGLFNGRLTISVRDEGDGIQDGQGLGLFIVRELVTAFHGSVELFSQATDGTIITVSWPLPVGEAYTMAVRK